MIKFVQWNVEEVEFKLYEKKNPNISFFGNIEWFDGKDIVGKRSQRFNDKANAYIWIANELKDIKEE